MLRGAPLRYRPSSGFSQANAPAPSMPVITTVNRIVDRYRFVNCSCRMKPPQKARRSACLDIWPGWYIGRVTFTVEIEREDDGRWLAEVPGFVRRHGEFVNVTFEAA